MVETQSIQTIEVDQAIDLLRSTAKWTILRLRCDIPIIGSSEVRLEQGKLQIEWRSSLEDYGEGELGNVLLLLAEENEQSSSSDVAKALAQERKAVVKILANPGVQEMLERFPLLNSPKFDEAYKADQIQGYKDTYEEYNFAFYAQILDWLNIGNFRAADDLEWLSEKNIKYILTVANNVDSPEYDASITHKVIPLDDEEFRISDAFEAACDFIREAKQQQANILVHCAAGANRSATCILCWLISEEGMSLYDAWELLWHKRPIVGPYANHCQCLIEHEMKKRGENSLLLVHMQPSHFEFRDRIQAVLK